MADLLASLLLQSSAHVNEVVGDHTEPNPALHADLASVLAMVEPLDPRIQSAISGRLGTTTSSVRFCARCSTEWDPHSFDTLGCRRCLLLSELIGGIRSHQIG